MAGVRKKPRANGKYVGWYMDSQGDQKFFAGVKSRAETLRIAQRLEDDHRQVRLGYRPAPKSADKCRSRSFQETVNEYLKWGAFKGGRGGRPWSKTHARMRKTHLKYWTKRLGLTALADLDNIRSQVEQAEQELGNTRTGKTVSNYVDAIRSFCSWASERGYLADNPLAKLGKIDTSPKTKRRAMTEAEIQQLLNACALHRRSTYEVAFVSGLRANELRQLTRRHLDAKRNGLHLDAAWTKNRKPCFQPLPRDLVVRLKEFSDSDMAKALYQEAYEKAGKDTTSIPADPLLYVPTHTARDMEKDLKAAGITKWTPEGKVDFHACRNAYITFVYEAGANDNEAQSLARHGTLKMTRNYARNRSKRLADVAEAVGKVIRPGRKYAVSRTRKAAGAENMTLEADTEDCADSGRRVRFPPPPPIYFPPKLPFVPARVIYNRLRSRTR